MKADQIREDLLRGDESRSATASRHGVSRQYVQQVAKKLGLPPRPKGVIEVEVTEADLEALYAEIQAGFRLSVAARRLGWSRSKLSAARDRFGARAVPGAVHAPLSVALVEHPDWCTPCLALESNRCPWDVSNERARLRSRFGHDLPRAPRRTCREGCRRPEVIAAARRLVLTLDNRLGYPGHKAAWERIRREMERE